MPKTRIYQPTPLKPHDIVQLQVKASHHLAHVLRKQRGDSIILFNGDGCDYEATITNIHKRSITVEITEAVSINRESPIEIELAQGIARSNKMDMVIQKAVELGVKRFSPLITERTQASKGEREEKRLKHWQFIAESAAEQCGRNRILEIHAPQTLDDWLTHLQAELRVVLSPHVTNQSLTPNQRPATLALLIGPEGGLSDHEIEKTLQKQFVPLNLGPRILRTETATIAALSILQRQYGDM